MSAAEVVALVPTYRRPALLGRALRSVLGQTWPGARASVFDNNSGDETEEVVAGLARGGRVAYCRHAENMGCERNFLYALAHVDAPFFSILSDDDLLLPRCYQEAMEAFARHPDAGFVCLDVLWANEQGDLRREAAMAGCPEGRYDVPAGLVAMARYLPTTWTGVVFRREVLEKIGTLDLEVGAAFDMDLVLRAAARFPFVLRHVPGAVFDAVSIGAGTSLRSSVDAFWPGWNRMVERFAGDPELPPQAREDVGVALSRTLERYLTLVGTAALVRGESAQASRAAQLLGRELGRRGRARALTFAARACTLAPILTGALQTAFAVRQRARHLAHRLRRGPQLIDLAGTGVV